MNKIQIKTKPNLGKRIYACVIDYGFIYAFMIGMLIFYGEQSSEGGYSLSGFPALFVSLFWGLMTIGIEQIFGTTLGNYLNDLKPISIKGDFNNLDLSLGQSIKRHLLDCIDIYTFGIIGIIAIKNSKYNQRLGDIWATTIVIDIKDKEQGIIIDNSL
ncbi:RDD family protein [Carboxylicivirga sp. N1Y90]|uniref:RDD family protein n=1 Tax=Carboxylicivirga fragile TaxID=3417571 RepID=UPI003D325AF4|nr:RDD family protein [Marinilabiliaceae bacterium N1Y90]